MTQTRAWIEWDDGIEMSVIFDDDSETAENDDDVFFYGWSPEVMDEFNYDGWKVTKVGDTI